MKLYLDSCCYNRPYDDQSQENIHLEGEAVLAIINRCRQNNDVIIGSSALDFEINNTADTEKREKVKYFYNKSITTKIDYTTEILKRAQDYKKNTGIRTLDIFHLSFAEYCNVDILLTTDIKFEKACSKLDLKIKVLNPLKYLLEVLNENNT